MIQHSKIYGEQTNYEFHFELNAPYEELIQMNIQIVFPEEFISDESLIYHIKI